MRKSANAWSGELSSAVALVVLSSAGSACSGVEDVPDPAGTVDCAALAARDAEPFQVRVVGDTMAGRLVIYVGGPLDLVVGSTVAVSWSGGELRQALGVTRCATFDLAGASSADVHVFGAAGGYWSLFGVAKEAVRIDVGAAPTGTAQVAVSITGGEALPAAVPQRPRYFAAVPAATRIIPGEYSWERLTQLDAPEPIVVEVPTAGARVIALGGVATIGATMIDSVEIERLGVATVAAGSSAVTVPLDVEFSEAVRIRGVVAPADAGAVSLGVGLVFAGDRVTVTTKEGTGDALDARLPAPSAVPMGQRTFFAGVGFAGDQIRSSFVRAVSADAAEVTLDRWLTPMGFVSLEGRTVRATVNGAPERCVFETLGGGPKWRAVHYGVGAAVNITLPAAPEGMADPLDGLTRFTVRCERGETPAGPEASIAWFKLN